MPPEKGNGDRVLDMMYKAIIRVEDKLDGVAEGQSGLRATTKWHTAAFKWLFGLVASVLALFVGTFLSK